MYVCVCEREREIEREERARGGTKTENCNPTLIEGKAS